MATNEVIYFEDIWNIVYNVLGIEDDDYGALPDDIAAAEQRLGRAVPLPLSSHYQQFERLSKLNSSHSCLLSLAQLYIDSSGLVFCQEQQNVAFWSVLPEDAHNVDPRVFQRGNADGTEYSSSLKAFLIGVTFWNAIWCLRSIAEADCSSESLKRFDGLLTSAQCVSNGPKGKALRAYYSSEVIVCAFPEQNKLYVASQSDDRLEEFAADSGVSLSWL